MMRRAQPWLGTVVDITVSDASPCEPAMRAAFDVVAEVHRLMSFHDRSSISVAAPVCMLADALTKVVAASGDDHHPLLARHGASAFVVTP